MVRRLLLLSAVSLATPAAAAEIQIQVQNPVVEMTVMEVAKAAPDTATIGAGVTTRAATASEAMHQNAQAMERVVARLVGLGIPRKDIQTSNFNLNPQYQYTREGEPPRFLGYEASNQVSVALRDLDRIGATLDALVAAGANNLYGPNFTLERDEEAKAAARRAAFERARQQATEYARLSGFSGLRLLEVSESFTGRGPMPVEGAVANMSAKDAGGTPVEPGRVGVGVQVTVKYEMTR